MRVLAFDTSGDWCTAALWRDGELLCREAHALQRHSELLLPMVDALLAEAGVTLVALDGIAYGAGPGSFTGLRIACAVAQGLAFGADLPVTGVGTLAALAWDAQAPRVLACLDARMGQVYLAAYQRTGDAQEEVLAPCLADPAALPGLPGAPGWAGSGNGFAVHGERLRALLGPAPGPVHAERFPHARDMAHLGAVALAAGHGVSADQAVPLYLRDRVALTIAERQAAAPRP